MQTAHTLTVSPSMLCSSGGCTCFRGVYLVWGLSTPGGVCSWGVYLVPGAVCSMGGVPGAGEVSAPGGSAPSGGVPAPGASALGGVYLVCGGGVPGPGGVSATRWSVPRGVYLVLGGLPGQVLPPVDRTLYTRF